MKTLIIISCFILLFVLIAPIGIDNIRELYREEITREILFTNITHGTTDLNTFFIPQGQIVNSSLTFATKINPILEYTTLCIYINDILTFTGSVSSGQMILINYNATNGINSFSAVVSNPSANFTSMDLFLKHEATVARADKITHLLFILQFFIVIAGVLFIARIFKSKGL